MWNYATCPNTVGRGGGVVALRDSCLKSMRWIIWKNTQQAEAELCQAQVKLEVIVEVWVAFGVEVEACYCYSGWVGGWLIKTKLMLISTLNSSLSCNRS